jgi:hypothetical protein
MPAYEINAIYTRNVGPCCMASSTPAAESGLLAMVLFRQRIALFTVKAVISASRSWIRAARAVGLVAGFADRSERQVELFPEAIQALLQAGDFRIPGFDGE